jgi:hypothetical protein
MWMNQGTILAFAYDDQEKTRNLPEESMFQWRFEMRTTKK